MSKPYSKKTLKIIELVKKGLSPLEVSLEMRCHIQHVYRVRSRCGLAQHTFNREGMPLPTAVCFPSSAH